MSLTVAAFYKFVEIGDGAELKARLLVVCATHAIKGTILIAPEGINATISGARADIDAVLAWFNADGLFSGMPVKLSCTPGHPFGRLKIRFKREIITFGVPEANPSKSVGKYVKPQDWNALISDPSVTVVDARNAYEVEIGTFERAQDPRTSSFTQFPEFVKENLDPEKHPRVAMFCTGGIRCEKASAYLLSRGFAEVYHLEGGILKYLETVPKERSLWRGECFVFDERVAVEHGLKIGKHVLCPSCGRAVRKPDETSFTGDPAIACRHCED